MPDAPQEPVDPDVDLRDPAQQTELRGGWRVLVVIAMGGVIGAEARYAASVVLLPSDPGTFPWAIFAVNVLGCLLIGILMAVLLSLARPHPLARPFLGVGVLGGFTTFSTYTVDTWTLLSEGYAATALAYLVGTLGAGLAAALAGHDGMAALLRRRRGQP